MDLRTISLAASGELKAIEMVDKRRERIAARKEAEMRQNRSLPDQEMLDRYIRQRLAERLETRGDRFDCIGGQLARTHTSCPLGVGM